QRLLAGRIQAVVDVGGHEDGVSWRQRMTFAVDGDLARARQHVVQLFPVVSRVVRRMGVVALGDARLKLPDLDVEVRDRQLIAEEARDLDRAFATVDLRIGADLLAVALEPGHAGADPTPSARTASIQIGDDQAIASTPRTSSRWRNRT